MQLKQRLYEHVRQLISFKEMLLMLSGEMSYARAPLAEAFSHIGEQGREPFSAMLADVSESLKRERGRTLGEIWKEAVEKHKSIFFSQEEFHILEGVGDNFGYLDIQMQLNNIALYVQQVEQKISEAQGELAVKQKLYQYLSVMCGLFVILLLI